MGRSRNLDAIAVATVSVVFSAVERVERVTNRNKGVFWKRIFIQKKSQDTIFSRYLTGDGTWWSEVEVDGRVMPAQPHGY